MKIIKLRVYSCVALPVVRREGLSIQKKSWILTKEAFEGLLARFDPDPERAGEQYELVRARLIKLFECRGCHSPQELTDETINRVARQIAEGKEIPAGSLLAYFCGVARNVLREHKRNPENAASSLDSLPPSQHPSDNTEELIQQRIERASLEDRLSCLESCISELPGEMREIMISYYVGDHGARIISRKQLAETLHIPLSNLRTRVHRAREKLERCLRHCLRKL